MSSSSEFPSYDREGEDTYWWNQTSSRNLMDSSVGNGLWDELFQEKSPTTLEQCSRTDEKKEQESPSIENKDRREEMDQFHAESLKNVTISSKNSVNSSSTGNDSKLSTFPTRIRENSVHSAKESSDSTMESQTMSDMTVHLDYARLKAEHRKLKKYFENAYESRYKTPPICETVKRLNRNESVPLDFYKSHREKMDLLDAALEQCDWDGVITVLLFLKRTLSNPLFRLCLIERPKAARHYINYLREAGDQTELIDTLFGLGQIAEAAMIEFTIACKWSEPKRQLESLRNCLLSGFSHQNLANERRHLEEWIALLETHLKRP